MKPSIPTAGNLLKTNGILTCSPEASLKEALSKLSRSHDACFVITEHNECLGLISPYFTIFKSKFPPETKVGRCLFKPPLVTLDTQLWDIAKLMVDAKTYFLPVIKSGKFLGIVTVNRIFSVLLQNTSLLNSVVLSTSKNIITLPDNSTVQTAYDLMRDKQISRIPLVNNQGIITGIITRYDIQYALTTPKAKPRFLSRTGERTKQLAVPITMYARKLVFTVSRNAQPQQILTILHTNTIGSVVVVNEKRQPVGIVTSYDILKSISALNSKKSDTIAIATDNKFLYLIQLEEMLKAFEKKLSHLTGTVFISITLKTHLNSVGKIRSYSVSLSVKTRKNNVFQSKTDDYDWKKAVSEAQNKILSQIRD
jgi:CBS domain-containing protein